MTSPEPQVGDIWLAWVEFSDHPGVGKVRPIVIVDVDGGACLALAAKVTSKDLRADASGKVVPIIDWESCGLRKPSYIRLDQRLEVPFDRLIRDEPIGRLPDVYLQIVLDALGFER